MTHRLLAIILFSAASLSHAQNPQPQNPPEAPREEPKGIEYKVPLAQKTIEIKITRQESSSFYDPNNVVRLTMSSPNYTIYTSKAIVLATHPLPPPEWSKLYAHISSGLKDKNCKVLIEIDRGGKILGVTVEGCDPIALGEEIESNLL